MYIRATGNISPQKSFGHPAFLTDPVFFTGNRLSCYEPDYKTFIDVKLIRRMSRIIRMGVAAGMECLQEAGIKEPDAIVTGTAYGCLEDTVAFLSRMVEHNEQLLNPTAFIQSTHNTIGAQVGLLLQCNNYNNAFVHRGGSFESALLDGVMLLKEQDVSNVLVGAIDEITTTSHAILCRMGLYKQETISTEELFKTNSKGTIAGEGAAFFLLTGERSDNDYARLLAFKTFYKPSGYAEIEQSILSFLAEHQMRLDDIDLIVSGKNGDASSNKLYNRLYESIFKSKRIVHYKNLCGEYPTSTAFALWMAVNVLKTATIPVVLECSLSEKGQLKTILIYNNYLGIHHSLFLVTAC